MGDSSASSPAEKLSPRQRQCLRLAYDRQTSKEIAAALGLSVGTVNTYITEAIGILQARNRRHAAELLHAAEDENLPPDKVQLHSEGVSVSPALPPVIGASSGDWRRLFPIRSKGAIGNDLGIFLRLCWPVLGGVIIAIGFGMLAVGMRVLSDICRVLR